MTDSLAYAIAALTVLVAAAVHYLLARSRRRLTRRVSNPRNQADSSSTVDVAKKHAIVANVFLLLELLVWVVALSFASGLAAPLVRAKEAALTLLRESSSAVLFVLGDKGFRAVDLLLLPIVAGGIFIAAGVVTRTLSARVMPALGMERGTQETISSLMRHLLNLLGILVVLHFWGIDTHTLAVSAGVLGVGVGFGLQNIANNVVSGVLINLERPIRPGDFVDIGALSGTVERIGARTTEIRTRDRVTILIPNSKFLETEVVNWSHGSPVSRIHIPVGVAYGTDLRRVRRILMEVAAGDICVLRDPRPDVGILGFGDSAVRLELLVWIRDPVLKGMVRSDLNLAVYEAFRRYGIEIPFPQHALHLSGPEWGCLSSERKRVPKGAPGRPDDQVAEVIFEPPAHEPPEPPDDRRPSEWTDAEVVIFAARLGGPDGLTVQDRRFLWTVYPRAFVGTDAVRWMMTHEHLTKTEALDLGRRMIELGIIRHVLDEHGFRDGNYFYRFARDETPGTKEDGRVGVSA